MSLMEKAMFWKKDDFSDLKLDDSSLGADLGLPPDTTGQASSLTPAMSEPGHDLSTPSMPGTPHMETHSQPSLSQPGFSQPSIQQPSYPDHGNGHDAAMSSHEAYLINKNIEIISSKLDAIRASMDSMNMRINNIERVALGEEDKQRSRSW